jgi:hypothetical protein
MNFNIKSIVKRPKKNNSEEISISKNDSINKKSPPKNNFEEPYFK